MCQTCGVFQEASPASPRASPRAAEESTTRTRTSVMHAAPLKYKPGTMRRWTEEDNKGVKILGIRWLLKDDRRDRWHPPWSFT